MPTAAPEWWIGDSVLVGRTRRVIRALDKNSGAVSLRSTNNPNASIWWHTTVDRLPRKEAR